MAGQRVYSTYFENVTVAAVQDVFLVKAGSTNGVALHQICLSAGGVTTPAEIRLRLKRLPATVTNGSGGTAPTIGVVDSGDTKSATATVRANDTTQATTGGTAVVLKAWQWQVLNEWNYLPAPEDREVIQATEGLVLEVFATPTSTAVSGWITWIELP